MRKIPKPTCTEKVHTPAFVDVVQSPVESGQRQRDTSARNTGVNLQIAEVPLERMDTDGAERRAFVQLHHSWAAAGVTRWFSLLRTGGGWPMFLLVAREEKGQTEAEDGGFAEEASGGGREMDEPKDRSVGDLGWLGAIVGVWSARPVERFDDLLESCAGGDRRGASRPMGGAWHLIAATVSEAARGMDLGRRLVGAALSWVQALSSDARVFTLSPAEGLPWLVEQAQSFWEGGAAGAALSWAEPSFVGMIPYVIHSVSREDGTPALAILRLHLGAGAALDRVLYRSRADEHRGGGVNLRFAYALEATEREDQRAHYRRWCAARAQAIREGRAIPMGGEEPLWWVTGFEDIRIWRESGAQESGKGGETRNQI